MYLYVSLSSINFIHSNLNYFFMITIKFSDFFLNFAAILKMTAILDLVNLGPYLILKSIISANFLEILVLLSLIEPFF